LRTRERRMIQGAKATSTKEMREPRKKGPVTWDALTRAVMAAWRVEVRDEWSSEGEVGRDGVLLGSWPEWWELDCEGGVRRRA